MDNRYLSAIQTGVELASAYKQKRKKVANELQRFGTAYELVLSKKYGISNLGSKVDYLPTARDPLSGRALSQNTITLTLELNGPEECIVPVLSCAFDDAGCYPCVLSSKAGVSVCSDLSDVKKSLIASCGPIGASLSVVFDELKASSARPTSNNLDNAGLTSESFTNGCKKTAAKNK